MEEIKGNRKFLFIIFKLNWNLKLLEGVLDINVGFLLMFLVGG